KIKTKLNYKEKYKKIESSQIIKSKNTNKHLDDVIY
ncbi:hypothetical protein MQM_02915, partial [Staphylococcus aureus subsp. aureus VRS7]